MMRRDAGFSLVELLMVVLILGFVLSATAEMFVSMLNGYRQQSKITETNIEGIIGLELLRRDLESGGYGLPWTFPANTTYSEAGSATATVYNDSPSNPPRAFVAGNSISGGSFINGSDYLVIKAINVARNDACTKWNILSNGAGPTPWVPDTENLAANDRVIIISPGSPEMSSRTLVSPTGDITTTGDTSVYSGVLAFSVTNESRLVYGVDDDKMIRPFNRADYYVAVPSSNLPRRCAQGTGILYKAVLNQANGQLGVPLPLLDCVADMQVVANLDTSVPKDGTADMQSSGYQAVNAQTVRDELIDIRVFILAHEGQRDTNYNHTTSSVAVGDANFDLAARITDWKNYRWKVYTLVVKPKNLR